jgi:hypothetical protein
MKLINTPKIGKHRKSHDHKFIMTNVRITISIHLIIVAEWQILNKIILAEDMIQHMIKINELINTQDKHKIEPDLELHHQVEAIQIKEQELTSGMILGNGDKIKKMAKLEITVHLIQTLDLKVDQTVDQDLDLHILAKVQIVINQDQVHIQGIK